MPRVASLQPKTRHSISIDSDLSAKVQLLLFSDAIQAVPYGAFGSLVEVLLRRFLDEVKDTDSTLRVAQALAPTASSQQS